MIITLDMSREDLQLVLATAVVVRKKEVLPQGLVALALKKVEDQLEAQLFPQNAKV